MANAITAYPNTNKRGERSLAKFFPAGSVKDNVRNPKKRRKIPPPKPIQPFRLRKGGAMFSVGKIIFFLSLFRLTSPPFPSEK